MHVLIPYKPKICDWRNAAAIYCRGHLCSRKDGLSLSPRPVLSEVWLTLAKYCLLIFRVMYKSVSHRWFSVPASSVLAFLAPSVSLWTPLQEMPPLSHSSWCNTKWINLVGPGTKKSESKKGQLKAKNIKDLHQKYFIPEHICPYLADFYKSRQSGRTMTLAGSLTSALIDFSK